MLIIYYYFYCHYRDFVYDGDFKIGSHASKLSMLLVPFNYQILYGWMRS